jgi:DNA-directed RNA polymerase sigma subunit (sigma70/sigma32)
MAGDSARMKQLQRDFQRDDWAERAYRYLRSARPGPMGNVERDPVVLKERRLCVLYLVNVVGCSLAEVGRHLHITREGVRRIHAAAMRAALDGTL